MKQPNLSEVPSATVIGLILEPSTGEPSTGDVDVTLSDALTYSDGSQIPGGATWHQKLTDGVLCLPLPLTLGKIAGINAQLCAQSYSVRFTLASGTYNEVWNLNSDFIADMARVERSEVIFGKGAF